MGTALRSPGMSAGRQRNLWLGYASNKHVRLGGTGPCVVSHQTLISDFLFFFAIAVSCKVCVFFSPKMPLLGEETDLVLVRRQLVRGRGRCDGH